MFELNSVNMQLFFLGISVFRHHRFPATVFNSLYLMIYVTSVLFVSEYYQLKCLVEAVFFILVRYVVAGNLKFHVTIFGDLHSVYVSFITC